MKLKDIFKIINEDGYNPETEEVFRKKLGKIWIDQSSKLSPEEEREMENADDEECECGINDVKSYVKNIDEEKGSRDKIGQPGEIVITKQPFASGLPTKTNTDFMDEDEIAKELGLMEILSKIMKNKPKVKNVKKKRSKT